MTPAEHYAESERLLGQLKDVPTRDASNGAPLPWEVTAATMASLLAHAQVHATLATCPVFFPQPHGLTEKEVLVLRDAASAVRDYRPTGSTRVSLLESALDKLGIEMYPAMVKETPDV